MTDSYITQVLILAKTYPSPSAQHIETSCIAGISEDGVMLRLYPVPFRLLEETQQFAKWQWINVRIKKSTKDHREESHQLYIDTLKTGVTISTRNNWAERRQWLNNIPTFDSFSAIQERGEIKNISLALLVKVNIIKLEIVKENPQWTDEEEKKLAKAQMQSSIFEQENEAKQDLRKLKKLPFSFYYHYTSMNDTSKVYKHKIVDWEIGALFWNCYNPDKSNWEKKFREQLEINLPSKDLMFLMGNIHRFQDQWLIISLIYPPKKTEQEKAQFSLF